MWTAVAGGGGILGMFLSAALVDFADWRWLFLLPVVLVVVALIDAARLSFVEGWQQAMWVEVAVMGALFLYVLFLGPRRSHC